MGHWPMVHYGPLPATPSSSFTYQLVPTYTRRTGSSGLGLLFEQLQPLQQKRIGNRVAATQLSRRLTPVKTDPTGGMLSGSFDELGEFLHRALQGKHLFDHHRFAGRGEALKRLQRFIHFLGFRIDVNTQEI